MLLSTTRSRQVLVTALVGLVALVSMTLSQATSVYATPLRSSNRAMITGNPYSGAYGPPNCTWYAWQRLHDVERIDLQFTANAADWISMAQLSRSAWSETANTYVSVEVRTSPSPGDLVVFPYVDGVWAYSSAGHVAFVEAVNGDLIQVSQQSYQDYRPGANTSPYPYVAHYAPSVSSIQRYQQGHARFLHFSGSSPAPATIDDAALVEQSSNPTVAPDQTVRIHFTLRDSGTTTWSNGAAYHFVEVLGACQVCSPLNISLGGSVVQPGQQVTFTIDLNTGPGGPCAVGNQTCGTGSWNPRWSMYHGNQGFGPTFQITVYLQSSGGTTNSCSPSNNGVTLYVDTNYGGSCRTFAPGEYQDLSQFGLSQNVSSLWNPNASYHMTLYDQPGLVGTPAYWDSSTTAITGYWNDRARSMRVEVHGPPSPPPTPTPLPPTPPPPPPPTVTPSTGPVATPFLFSPASGSSFVVGQSIYLAFNYHATEDEAYVELIDPNGAVTAWGWSHTTIVSTPVLTILGQYKWHAKARDSLGNESIWSDFATFTVTSAPTPTPCPYLNGGSGVTFYSGPNYTGQSWTWYVPAGNVDSYANLPSGIAGNLGSFYDANNAWHVVLYQSQNGSGNLGHYDASWSNVDSYWHNTQSVKIYINRAC